MRVKNITQEFEGFVPDLQGSFWGDFQGQARQRLKELLEKDAEQQMAEQLGLKWHAEAQRIYLAKNAAAAQKAFERFRFHWRSRYPAMVRHRRRPMVVWSNVESVERIIYAIFSRFNEDWETHTLNLFTHADYVTGAALHCFR